MAAIPAGIRFIVQWGTLARVPAPNAPIGDDLGRYIKELDTSQLKRLDEPPADPSPPPKQKPKPSQPIGDAQPTPQPQPSPQGQRWRVDPKTCTITRPPGKNQDELMTMAVIAGNCAQAMTEAYNRGYATGRAVSKKWTARCVRARDDAAWLDKRLKRILLSQDNPQTHHRKVYSRKR